MISPIWSSSILTHSIPVFRLGDLAANNLSSGKARFRWGSIGGEILYIFILLRAQASLDNGKNIPRCHSTIFDHLWPINICLMILISIADQFALFLPGCVGMFSPCKVSTVLQALMTTATSVKTWASERDAPSTAEPTMDLSPEARLWIAKSVNFFLFSVTSHVKSSWEGSDSRVFQVICFLECFRKWNQDGWNSKISYDIRYEATNPCVYPVWRFHCPIRVCFNYWFLIWFSWFYTG